MTTFTVLDSWADFGTVSGTVTFTPFPARTGSPVVAQLSNSTLSVALPVGNVTGIQQYLASFSNVTLNGFAAKINPFSFPAALTPSTVSMRGLSANLAPVASLPLQPPAPLNTEVTDEADQRTLGASYRSLKGVTAAISSSLASGSGSSGVGSTLYWNPALNSPAYIPWRYCGAAPVALTANPYVGINNNNGEGNNSWWQPITIEFWSDATKIDVYSYMYTNPDVWAVVDDERILDGTYQHYTSSDGEVTWTLTQSNPVWRKWRLSVMTGFIGIAYNVGAVVVPTTPGFQLAVLGDSYVQGGIDTNNAVSNGVAGLISSGNPWGEFEQFTGLDVWRCGLQGTGYVNEASLSTAGPYGSTARIAALAGLPPMDAVVVFGSVNDNASSASTVVAAAEACWAAVATAQPTAIIIVVGPECLNVTPGAGVVANNNALKTAAEASGIITAYIDLLENAFITGTGYDGSPAGDGNADVFISGDDLHPTHMGSRYWGEHLAELLAPIEFQGEAFGGGY